MKKERKEKEKKKEKKKKRRKKGRRKEKKKKRKKRRKKKEEKRRIANSKTNCHKINEYVKVYICICQVFEIIMSFSTSTFTSSSAAAAVSPVDWEKNHGGAIKSARFMRRREEGGV